MARERQFGGMVETFHRGRLAGHPIYRRDDGRMDEAHLEGYFAEYRLERTRPTGGRARLGIGSRRRSNRAVNPRPGTSDARRRPQLRGNTELARDRGLDRAAVADTTDLDLRTGFDTMLAVGKRLTLGRSRVDFRRILEEPARVTNPRD